MILVFISMNLIICILYCVNEFFIINLNENNNKVKSMVYKMFIKILNKNKYYVFICFI